MVVVVGGTGLQWWWLAVLGCCDGRLLLLLGIEEWVREGLIKQERGEAIGMAAWWLKPPCQWSSHWRCRFGGLIIGVTILVAISIIGPPVLVVTEPLILVVHLKIL